MLPREISHGIAIDGDGTVALLAVAVVSWVHPVRGIDTVTYSPYFIPYCRFIQSYIRSVILELMNRMHIHRKDRRLGPQHISLNTSHQVTNIQHENYSACYPQLIPSKQTRRTLAGCLQSPHSAAGFKDSRKSAAGVLSHGRFVDLSQRQDVSILLPSLRFISETAMTGRGFVPWDSLLRP